MNSLGRQPSTDFCLRGAETHVWKPSGEINSIPSLKQLRRCFNKTPERKEQAHKEASLENIVSGDESILHTAVFWRQA